MTEDDREMYRATFAGIVQGRCEQCGECDDDADGMCPCDHVVEQLVSAVERIHEEGEA